MADPATNLFGVGGSLPFRVLNATASPRYDARAFVSGLQATRDTWGDFVDRLLRYEVYGAIWEGNIYKAVHAWAGPLKLDHDLYDFTRLIRSPGKRVVEFWGSKTYPGLLDLDAGDGKARPSACPIDADRDYLRPLIARLWRDSAWQVNKDIYSRLGACHGDVFLHVVDDPGAGRVYFVAREARSVYHVSKDARGNVIGYTIVEHRADPSWEDDSALAHPPWVLYVEECWKGTPPADGEPATIHYRTSIGRAGSFEPHDWGAYADGEVPVGPEWEQPYGFVPLIHVQNRDVGKGWGWSVYQGSVDKLLEVDDLASKLHDYFRKVVDNDWFVSGARPGEVRAADDDDGDREATRQDRGLIFGPSGSRIEAMVAPLNVADGSKHLDSYDSAIVQDFPELMAEDVSPAASGASRRVAREKVEAEVVQHRSPYDAGLVAIHKMCLSIWITKKYPGLPDGLSVDSYRKGELDHTIGDRPTFAMSEAHRLEVAAARAAIVADLVHRGGMPLGEAMRAAGYPEEQVARAESAQGQVARDAEAALRAGQVATFANIGGTGP